MKQSPQSWLWWTCLVPFHAMKMDGSGSCQHPLRGEAAQRVVNTPELGVGRQAGERAGEMRVPRAGEDVLPAVGFEQGLLDHAGLELGQPPPAGSSKVIAVGGGLPM